MRASASATASSAMSSAARVLLHLVDGTAEDAGRGLPDRSARELEAYGDGLADKPEIVALSKVDALDAGSARRRRRRCKRARQAARRCMLVGVTGEGVEDGAARTAAEVEIDARRRREDDARPVRDRWPEMARHEPSASRCADAARRIVVKIGSALLVDRATGRSSATGSTALADDIAALRARGSEVIVVSSGAIALGRRDPGAWPAGALQLEESQAAAAVGQIAPGPGLVGRRSPQARHHRRRRSC